MWYDYKIALFIMLCENYHALYDMIVSSVRFCQCERLFDRKERKKDGKKKRGKER